MDRSDPSSGLPEMSARWLPVPLRALSTPLVTGEDAALNRVDAAQRPVAQQRVRDRVAEAAGICQSADVTQR